MGKFKRGSYYSVNADIRGNSDFDVNLIAEDQKIKFKNINYDLSWNVPSDLLGKLYTKGKELYFALKDESRIDDAKKWLKDNKLEAVLILGKED